MAENRDFPAICGTWRILWDLSQWLPGVLSDRRFFAAALLAANMAVTAARAADPLDYAVTLNGVESAQMADAIRTRRASKDGISVVIVEYAELRAAGLAVNRVGVMAQKTACTAQVADLMGSHGNLNQTKKQ